MNNELIEQIDYYLKYHHVSPLLSELLNSCKAALTQQQEFVAATEDCLLYGTGIMLNGKRIDPAEVCLYPESQQQEAEPVNSWLPGAIARDICETDPYDPDAPDAVCIDQADLMLILERFVGAEADPIYLHPPKPAAQPQVPEGWRLVPVEPTQRMMKAAFECGPYPDLRVMWDAALTASKGEQ